MRRALDLARQAWAEGEVPVGCVVAGPDGAVIGAGRNRREGAHSALAHAEVEAIGAACRELGSWRLEHCALYVTLEPCPMCAGAILNARIPEVFFGAAEDRSEGLRRAAGGGVPGGPDGFFPGSAVRSKTELS